MKDDKPDQKQNSVEAEQLWAVHIQGPDDVVAMISRKAADAYASEINTAYEAEALSRKGALPNMHAVVIPSPWPAVEHWRRCVQIQEEWIAELTVRLQKQAQEVAERVYLVPDEEAMAKAWYGEQYAPGQTQVPSDVRAYTMALLGKLPARAVPAEAAPMVRPMPSTELIARAIEQARAGLEPGDVRDILELLCKWGVITRGSVSALDLEGDEACTQDFQAAQIASEFDPSVPAQIWRAAYAAAMSRYAI